MADIILYDKNGNPVTYTDTGTLTVDTTTEGKQQTYTKGVAVEGLEIPVEFAGGDMILVAAENTLVKSAVIKKPDTLIPENVRNGVAIGGVEGNFIGETEETTVALDLADGDQIVFPPTEGKALSKVTIQKPETLLPENILKDIVIAGVRGSHEVLPLVYGSGTFTPTAAESTVTVSHQLGMIPDIVFISAINPTVTVNGLRYIVSMSTGLAKAVGADDAQNLKVYAGNAGIMGMSIAYGIDVDNPETAIMVHGAGVKTFKVTGASLAPFVPNKEHSWAAFCGIVPHSDYFYIRLDIENYTNLIVTGGVPEIQQLEIYVDGSLAKTVDYIYGDTFTVDISDVADDYSPHTITVKALGDTLAETRPKQYYDSVSNGILAGGTCGDSVKWKLTSAGDMTIFGSGAIADYTASTEQPWYSWAASIKTVVIEDGITEIGSCAFSDCTAVTSLDLPSKLTNIPDRMCYGCTSLTEITIPNEVTIIGDHAFRQCSSLTNASIPDCVTTIGYCAFYLCSSLTEIVLPANLVTLGDYAFNSTGLISVTIPDNVVTIGKYAFRLCSSLESVVIGNGVETIELYAFSGNSKLTSVTMGSSVKKINYRAFQDCSALTSIVIPATVTLIGDNAFYNCSKLTSATFKDTTTWKYYTSETATSGSTISSSSLANTTTAATYLRSTYVSKWWKKT